MAVGEGWVAVVTSDNYLRQLSSGGMQRSVVCLPGPLVSLAGHASLLLLACHSAQPSVPRRVGFNEY